MKTSLYILTILAMLLQTGLAPWFSPSVLAGPQASTVTVQTPTQAVEPSAKESAEVDAVLVVNSAADTDDGACDASHCTLREAIHYAARGDTINFAAGLSGATIILTSPLDIGGDLNIDASALGARVRISGNHSVLVLFVDVGAVASLNFLEIINGGTDGWEGGIFNRGLLTLTNTRLADNALGINNESTLTVNNSIIENNGGLHGWGIYCEGGQVNVSGSTIQGNGGETGGGISASSLCPVNVSNSTITANDEGIRNYGTMTLQNVTISDHDGRGIWNRTGGNVTLQNVTITGNSLGLGNDLGSTLNFTNTLVANSYYTYYQDCVNNGTISINNHNLIEDGTCGAALSGDPLLGPLQVNGGNTETHALLAGSLAIDAGDNSACPAADQRGFRRPADGDGNGSAVCDIGAFELSYSLVVNSSADVDDGACSVSHCTLREAISQAVSGTTITFDASLSGATIVLASVLNIDKSLTIDASALSSPVRISGNHTTRVFFITGVCVVNLISLEITDGAGGDWAGGIYNASGTLILTSTRIANNSGHTGGGVTNEGNLTIIDSTFDNNTAEVYGGGIFSYSGQIEIRGSTFRKNSAAIYGGGGFSDHTSSNAVSMTNTTFSENVGRGISSGGNLELMNVTITGSTGSGIYNSGILAFTHTLVANSSMSDCFNDGTIIGNYLNLVEDGTCDAAFNGDPQLGLLEDNGGRTLTHALLSGSPAIDAGDNSPCPATDQRGVERPKDGNDDGSAVCDIGAYELSYELDYGDAPSPYPTLKADNGAGHFLRTGFHLGTQIDNDPDGYPSALADGDDTHNLDDEDGVTFTAPLRSGESSTVDVSLTGAGYLHAWIDFNHDGDWADAGEKSIPGIYNTSGTHAFTFLVPPEAAIATTMARFRFTSRPNLAYNGIAVDGEVEDYAVAILRGHPVAVPDSASLDEGTSILIDVLANDYDPHGTVSIQAVGSAAHGSVAIESGKIRYTPNANYSGPESFPYTIVNDIGLSGSARVTLFVFNVNSAPTDIQIYNLQALVATCNASGVCTLPANKLVGTLKAVDPDPVDAHIFNLVNSSEFRLSGSALYTQTAITFTGSDQSIQRVVNVSATDSGNLKFTKPITLFILGDRIGGGPELITLSNYQVAENLPAGTLVGTLATQEDTPHAPYTYTLVSGEGSNDNANFQINGLRLETAGPLDFEQKELNKVRIRTLSSVGQSKDQIFTIQLLDVPGEPPQPPPNCSAAIIELIDSGDVHMSVLNVTASNVTLQGCDIAGDLSLSFPGWSGGGFAFAGKVNQGNQVTAAAGSIATIDMQVAGVPMKVQEAALEFYDGRSGLRLEDASFCLPSDWGGLCAPALGGGVSMMIDDSGLKMGGGLKLEFPDIKVGNQVNLSGLTGMILPVPGGYEITLGGKLGLPKFKPGGASECGISASVVLYAGAAGEVVMEIHASPSAINAVGLREITVGVSCDTGIPIDSTGMALTGVEGTISLRPDSKYVSLTLTVSTVKKIPGLNISPIKAEGTAKLMWDPEWGLDLSSTVYLLEVFKTSETAISIRPNRLSFTANFTSFLVKGQLSINAWTDWASFHLTGRGEVEVGFFKGSILHECFCIPYPTRVCWKWCFPYPCGWKQTCGCLDILPFNLYVTLGAEFGEFTNGAWGFKGYVDLPILGDVGIYIDSEPSLHIGGMSKYTLVTPPGILEALRQWRTARDLGIQNVGPVPAAQTPDIRVVSDTQVTLRVPVNMKSTAIDAQDQEITPVELETQKNTLFTLTSAQPLLMTLQAPDGTLITPSNYNQPPVTPNYTVEYSQNFHYQSNAPEEAATADQPRLRFVLAATHPDWAEVDVSLDGTLLFAALSLDDPAPVDYIPINPGEHTLAIVPSGGGTPRTLSFNADFKTYYTVLASGNGATPILTALTDDHTAPSAQGMARLRFVHGAPYPDPVDVFVKGVQVLDDVSALGQSLYFEFAAGEALVEIKDAASGVDIAPAQVIDLTAGGVYSLFDAVYPVGEYQLAWGQYFDEGFVERYTTQYKVFQAPSGEWEVTLDGDLDTTLPMLSVLGFANPPVWERVEAQASDPAHPELTWEVRSDYLPTTVSIYANPGAYETGGEPVYQGIQIAEVALTVPENVAGIPFVQPVDLSALESGSYTLWVRVQDGVNPPVSAYALQPGSSNVAVFTLNQSATFPTTWNPAITPVLSSAQARLFLEWQALLHPDVDSYNLYLNTLPLTPVKFTEGLSAFRETNASGEPVGPVLVNTSVAELVPGATYYYSVEAVDSEGGKSVRSPEASIAIPSGNFKLTTPSGQYLVTPGDQVSFPLSLEVPQPLFFPNVGLNIGNSLTPPGMRIWFDTPLEGDAYLNATDYDVTVRIDLSAAVPDDIYPVTFIGSNGGLKRSHTVYILVNPAPTDMQITGDYVLSGQDQVTFTFTAENLGSARGDGVQVNIPFPSSITNITWTCLGTGGVTCGSGTGTVMDWIGNFLPGETATYTITGRYRRMDPFQVTADLNWLGVDTNLANNHTTLEGFVLFVTKIYK